MAGTLTWNPEQVAWTRAQLARLPHESQADFDLDSLTLLSITLPSLLDEIVWLQKQLAITLVVGRANADVAHEALGDAPAAQSVLARTEALTAAGYEAELRTKGRLYQHPQHGEDMQP